MCIKLAEGIAFFLLVNTSTICAARFILVPCWDGNRINLVLLNVHYKQLLQDQDLDDFLALLKNRYGFIGSFYYRQRPPEGILRDLRRNRWLKEVLSFVSNRYMYTRCGAIRTLWTVKSFHGTSLQSST